MKRRIIALMLGCCLTGAATAQTWTADSVVAILTRVNNQWQRSHPEPRYAFWDEAAYHTGNMEAYRLTGNEQWRDYSLAWAEHNQWQGAASRNPQEWEYKTYSDDDRHVLFGDWQICFQTYIDLYLSAKDVSSSDAEGLSEGQGHIKQERMTARAREVMAHEIATEAYDYWWWADALYMVMPVMTRMYHLTADRRYLERMHRYWQFTDSIMYDPQARLYYRDAKYIYPRHQTDRQLKDFWARGDGWVMAALALTLRSTPADDPHRKDYRRRFRQMARAVAACQQPEGYWTRSLLDPQQAPGPESSGTALFTFALSWGINNGLLSARKYRPVCDRAWQFLATTALQTDHTVGYVQPAGEKAIPGQTLGRGSTSNFGTGVFLLAACEYSRLLMKK